MVTELSQAKPLLSLEQLYALLRSAERAKAAYSSPEEFKIWALANGYQNPTSINIHNDVRVNVAESNDATTKTVHICFAGTNPKRLENLLTDAFAIPPLHAPMGGYGHHGFIKQLDTKGENTTAWKEIVKTIKDAHRVARASGQKFRLTLQGHSLGGPLSIDAAERLNEMELDRFIESIHTMEAPFYTNKIGAKIYNETFGERTIQIANPKDLIPKMPAGIGLVHVGNRYHLPDSGPMTDTQLYVAPHQKMVALQAQNEDLAAQAADIRDKMIVQVEALHGKNNADTTKIEAFAVAVVQNPELKEKLESNSPFNASFCERLFGLDMHSKDLPIKNLKKQIKMWEAGAYVPEKKPLVYVEDPKVRAYLSKQVDTREGFLGLRPRNGIIVMEEMQACGLSTEYINQIKHDHHIDLREVSEGKIELDLRPRLPVEAAKGNSFASAKAKPASQR